MEPLEGRVMELKLQGLCCAQIVLSIVGLEAQGLANPDMVRAMRGLCYGMQAQHTCGALTGGACALALYDFDGEALRKVCSELSDWFEAEIGGPACSELIGLGGRAAAICGEAILQTVKRCMDILEENDKLLDGEIARK